MTGGQRRDSTQAQADAWADAPRPCLRVDRAYGGDAFRAWLAQRSLKVVMSARGRRPNPQPHAPERYKARNAAARGRGGLKGWRRVAPRSAQYAHRGLGFLYLAGAWIWRQSNVRTI